MTEPQKIEITPQQEIVLRACIGKLYEPGGAERVVEVLRALGHTFDGPADFFRLSYSEHMRQSAREYLVHVLSACNWNVRLAAEMAKKNRTAFHDLMRRLGIKRPAEIKQPVGAHRGRWQEFGL